MSHRYHPDPEKGDPPVALLFDDCERCDSQAADPRYLDDTKLAQAYETCKQDDWSGTQNERKLLKVMYLTWCIIERLSQIGRLP